MKNILNDAIEIWEVDDFYKVMSSYRGPYIYAWYNKTNKRIYIGSSVRLVGRFSNYYRAINGTAKFHSVILTRVFSKYKKEDFLFLILKKLTDKSECLLEEQKFLDYYEPFGENGYNISKNAESNIGIKISEEECSRRSIRYQGEKGPNSKLKDADIIDIFNDFSTGSYTQKQLYLKYGVSRRQIYSILTREQWSHIKIDEKILEDSNKNLSQKVTKETAIEIAKRLQNGVEVKEIAGEFGCRVHSVNMINNGKSYKEIKQSIAPNQKYIHDFKPKNRRDEELCGRIRVGVLSGLTNRELMRTLGVSSTPVIRIRKLLGVAKQPKILSSEEALSIGEDLLNGLSYKEIMKKRLVSAVSIHNINCGKTHKEVKEALGTGNSYIRNPPKFVPLSKAKKMVFLIKNGLKPAAIIKETGLSRTYISKWIEAIKNK